MDAKILGNYIAARRKELGMTQAKSGRENPCDR